MFIGMLEQLPSEPGTGRLWVTQEGVIVCCDPGFVTHFGWVPLFVLNIYIYIYTYFLSRFK